MQDQPFVLTAPEILFEKNYFATLFPVKYMYLAKLPFSHD